MDPLVELLGESPGIVAVRKEIGRLLQRSSATRRLLPVLIQGETGTGKGLVARAIHRAGPRANGPFVDINCAAIPETLLEAELFGFERGAFTDARQAKPGLFQTAHRGTLFLDEIGLMPAGLQVKLLKAIEERVVRRLGSTRTEAVDVWILAATSEDLVAGTQNGRFRADLYHRLAAVTVVLPPLRERGGDICLLAEHFLSRACADYALAPKALAPDACARLTAYPWPGNVRELANVIERVALLKEGSLVTAQTLGLPDAPESTERHIVPTREVQSLDDAVRAHILDVLNCTGWNLSRTAALLGISRNTLSARIQKYGLRCDVAAPVRRKAPASTSKTAPAAKESEPVPDSDESLTRTIAFLGITLRPMTDECSAPVSTEHLGLIGEKVTTFNGRIEDLRPSGVVATFGVEPIDDPAASAVHVALAVKNAVERAATDPASRIGTKAVIHVADCRLFRGSQGYDLDPLAKEEPEAVLNALADTLEPDSILVSPAGIPFLQQRFALAPVAAAQGQSSPALLVTRVPPISGKPSIAVMPFRNLTGDPDWEYIGEGITEDIVGALSRLRWLFVIARTSMLAHKSRETHVRQIAGELGVRYLLTGTVRRTDAGLRVTADLVDADAGYTIWAERFDGELGDVFKFQDDITARIAGTLDAKVRFAEIERALRKRPENLDAYDSVLRALWHLHRLTEADSLRAKGLLEQAVSLDPSFALAYAWQAWWFLYKIGEGWSSEPDVDMSEAGRLAETALAHDHDDPMALAISGHVAAFLHRSYDKALGRFERALALNSNCALAWGLSAATFCYIGQPAVALERVIYALRLSPFDLLTFYFLGLGGFAQMLLGNYDEAILWAQKSRDANPRFTANLRVLVACLAHIGRLEEARQLAQEFLAFQKGFTLSGFVRRYPLRDRAALDVYAANLRKAGLPD